MRNLTWEIWEIFVKRYSVSFDNNSEQHQCLWNSSWCWQNSIPYNSILCSKVLIQTVTSIKSFFFSFPHFLLRFGTMWTMEMTIVIINFWDHQPLVIINLCRLFHVFAQIPSSQVKRNLIIITKTWMWFALQWIVKLFQN